MKNQELLINLIKSIKSGRNNDTEKYCDELLLLDTQDIILNDRVLSEWVQEIRYHNYDFYPVGILQDMDTKSELSQYLGYTIFDIGKNTNLPLFDETFSIQVQTPVWTFDDAIKNNLQNLIHALENNDGTGVQEILQSEIWEDLFYETLDSSAPDIYFDINFIVKEITIPQEYDNILALIKKSKAIEEYLKK